MAESPFEDESVDPAAMSEAEAESCNATEREQWEISARHIIGSKDVLSLFARDLGKVIAGEKLNAKMLYLVATSRLFGKCMNAAIKGTSSGGKSEIRKQVLEFFPPETVVSFSTLSEKSLLYYEDDFAHKILSMGEASGTDEQSLQDYLLRELISEGRLRYPVVQKIEGVGLTTVTIEKNGPVAFMVTTTRNTLHPENETRLLSLEIDDSEDQTRAVLRKVAQVEGLNHGGDAIDYEPWRDFQRWLESGERRVVVPFAGALSEMIPAASVRLRRDFGQMLRALKAHALLHRQHRDIDKHGQIVADIDHDYAVVRQLMNALIAESSGVAVNQGLTETIDAVRLACEGLAPEDGANAQAIAKHLKLDKSAAWRRLRAATSEGFIKNMEVRRGQPGRYRTSGQKVEIAEMLPSPESLQPVQPRNRKCNRQPFERLSDCNTGCTVAPVASDTDASPPQSASDIADFEERAAILEYECGLSREDAEAQAATEPGWPELPEFLDRRRTAEQRKRFEEISTRFDALPDPRFGAAA